MYKINTRDRSACVGWNKKLQLAAEQIIASLSRQDKARCITTYNSCKLYDFLQSKLKDVIDPKSEKLKFHLLNAISSIGTDLSLIPVVEDLKKGSASLELLLNSPVRTVIINNCQINELLFGILSPAVSSNFEFEMEYPQLNKQVLSQAKFDLDIGGRINGLWDSTNILTTISIREGVVFSPRLSYEGVMSVDAIFGLLLIERMSRV